MKSPKLSKEFIKSPTHQEQASPKENSEYMQSYLDLTVPLIITLTDIPVNYPAINKALVSNTIKRNTLVRITSAGRKMDTRRAGKSLLRGKRARTRARLIRESNLTYEACSKIMHKGSTSCHVTAVLSRPDVISRISQPRINAARFIISARVSHVIIAPST